MRLVTALGLFTLVPVPMRNLDRRAAAGAMAAFPLVGLLLGLFAGALAAAGAAVGVPWLGAVAALAVLAGLTGGLHLDGVADVADALGSRRPRKRMLEIMKQSDIGPMGVIALLLVLLAQLAAIIDLTGALGPLGVGAAVALAAAAGRLGCLFASRGPSARPGGFGSLVAGTPGAGWVVGNAVGLLALTAAAGWWLGGCHVVGLPVAVAFALGIGFAWSRRLVGAFGGTTGDVFGSVIEVTQTAALVALAVAAHLAA